MTLLNYVVYLLSCLYLQVIVLHGLCGLFISKWNDLVGRTSAIYYMQKYMVVVTFASFNTYLVDEDPEYCTLSNTHVIYH